MALDLRSGWPTNFGQFHRMRKSSEIFLKDSSRRCPVVLKIFTNDLQNREEINVYNRLMSVQSKRPGRNYIRNALDTFTIQGPNGEHRCLVHEPMLESVQELLRRNPSHRFTEDLLKVLLQYLLSALDYLHTDAHIIHTGKTWLPIMQTRDLTGLRHQCLEHSSPNRGQINHPRICRGRTRKPVTT